MQLQPPLCNERVLFQGTSSMPALNTSVPLVCQIECTPWYYHASCKMVTLFEYTVSRLPFQVREEAPKEQVNFFNYLYLAINN